MSKYLLLLASMMMGTAFADIHVGLTVDDLPAAGSSYKGIDRLAIMKKYLVANKSFKLPAQYGFINGVYLEGMSERFEIIQLWKKAGHYVGNHTYSHDGLGKLGLEKFKKDIERNESYLVDFAKSIEELKYFRFPFLDEGSTKELRYGVRSYLKKRNYKIAQVSVDTSDWMFNSAYIRCLEKGNNDDAQKIVRSFIDHTEKAVKHREQEAKFIWGAQKKLKQIILLHMTPLLADSAQDLFKMFQKNKWKVIDAKEALDDKTYLEDTTYIHKNGKDYIMQALETRGFQKRTLTSPIPPAFLGSVCK